DADAPARHLVFIARAYAARCSADRNAPRPVLGHLLHHPVRGKHYVSAVADKKVPGHRNPGGFERVDLRKQRGGVNYQPIADHRLLARTENTAWDQLQNILLLPDIYRVPGVVPTLVAHHDVELFREQVDNLSLALIAPLRSH